MLDIFFYIQNISLAKEIFEKKQNKEQPALNNTKTTASLLRMKDISNLDVTLHPGN